MFTFTLLLNVYWNMPSCMWTTICAGKKVWDKQLKKIIAVIFLKNILQHYYKIFKSLYTKIFWFMRNLIFLKILYTDIAAELSSTSSKQRDIIHDESRILYSACSTCIWKYIWIYSTLYNIIIFSPFIFFLSLRILH